MHSVRWGENEVTRVSKVNEAHMGSYGYYRESVQVLIPDIGSNMARNNEYISVTLPNVQVYLVKSWQDLATKLVFVAGGTWLELLCDAIGVPWTFPGAATGGPGVALRPP